MQEVETLVREALGGDIAAAETVLAQARQDGLSDLGSAILVREDEWVGYGMPRLKARMLVAWLKAKQGAAAAPSVSSLLPVVPDDESLLVAMRVGGVAKIAPTDVVAALRVAFADRLGLLQVEAKLLAAIEKRARDLDEPCPDLFYELQRTRSRKAHAEVLAAIGVPGTFVTERRKAELIDRTGRIWQALADFQQRLEAWQAGWQERVSNPGALLAGIAALVAGDTGSLAGASLMEAPDTAPVLDASRAVIDVANKAFAGVGIPVARALAADAMELKALIERADLVAAVGADSREELLRTLGLAVSADLVRAEKAVVQYALGVLQLPDGEEAQRPMLIVALKELGATIPWALLMGGPSAAPRGPRGLG